MARSSAEDDEMEDSLLELDTDGDGSLAGDRRPGLRCGLKPAASLLGVALLLVLGLSSLTKSGTRTSSIGDSTSLLGLPQGLQQMLGSVHLPPPPQLPFGPAPAPAYPYNPAYGQPGMQPGMQPGVQPGMQPGMQPAMQPVMQPQAPTQQSYDCDTGYHISGWVSGWTPEQMEWCCAQTQRGCREPRLMSFYMYRAQSDEDYSMQNVNLGDLPGVMWYLHNEIIVSQPRKYNVTRLMRFRVTMKTTRESYASVGQKQFGQFTAFDSGMCTVPDCGQIFQKNGYVVGCQNTDSSQGLGNYVSQTSIPCTPPNCKEGTWYSMPGPCPSYYYGQRPDYCNVTEPGGQCQFLYGEGGGADGVTGFEIPPVSGEKDCAYYTKWAGQIYLNELIGVPVFQGGQKVHYQEYTQWWEQGNEEYSVLQDEGVCLDPYADCTFWNGRNDQMACSERMTKIQDLFDTKFPFYPKTADLGEAPPCDAA